MFFGAPGVRLEFFSWNFVILCPGSWSVGDQIRPAAGGTLIKCPINNKGTNKSCLAYLRKKMRNSRDLQSFSFPERDR
jgi:hypothetical protein